MFYRISKLCELTGLQRQVPYRLMEKGIIKKIEEDGFVGTDDNGLTILMARANRLQSMRKNSEERKSHKLLINDTIYSEDGSKHKVVEIDGEDVVLYHYNTRNISIITKENLSKQIDEGVYLLNFNLVKKSNEKQPRKEVARNYYVYSKCNELYGSITASTTEGAKQLATELYGLANWSRIVHIKIDGVSGKEYFNNNRGILINENNRG